MVRGEKTATRRGSRPMVKPGGVYRLRADFFDYRPDRYRVLRVYTQRLGEMTPEDALKEGAASLDEFRREWVGIYGSWDDDETVWVVEFEYLGADRKV
ncbi:MAG: ASCH domain-containing protein [Candidatus Bathyarchaeia archaeon]